MIHYKCIIHPQIKLYAMYSTGILSMTGYMKEQILYSRKDPVLEVPKSCS